MSHQDNLVGSVGTSFAIIEYLKENDDAGITDISRGIGVTKSTVFNHVRTLEDNDVLIRHGDQYRLSLKFLDYGEHVRRNVDLFRVGKSLIDDLSEGTGEVANIMVPENGRGVYLYKSMGEKAVKHDTRAGKRICLHCTALGKSILSQMSESEVDAVIEQHGLAKMTESTITSRDELFEELEQIRERGYAINTGERNERVRCVGAPIQAHGEVRGAISVSGPETRMKNDEFIEGIATQVQETANVIEINLEHG
ncbi:DNA-binding transcriptional regulator, IclR family [Halanaeroarchaeum sp. HSR-CO]|uniref:IclR family transcriptional regulator n=1 Tax=Halanaeroarchaeum sp. HSR-CO TaxID=2866382 RepID=UPI00217E453E|nr:IclR family transcriptional regulator [Halanaeroarchaeum sp. HSR-CO]UWG46324.1 DNA-binding transcriptional regulator, IclR family [Halanaeroarchaeum sp. HSR-CO]